MEKWRIMSLPGIILGIMLIGIDHFVTEIPYMIYIPLQIVAIAVILGGFIYRKRERTQEERAEGQEDQR